MPTVRVTVESHAHSEGTGFIALPEAFQGGYRATVTNSTQTIFSLYFPQHTYSVFPILSLLVVPYGLSHTS